MSWLNTASIANLAKSALKEAQKTIDKALDIRDTDTGVAKQSVDHVISKEIGHFFESFNLAKDEDELSDETVPSSFQGDVVVSEPSSNTETEKQISLQEVSDQSQNEFSSSINYIPTVAAGGYPNQNDHAVAADSVDESNINESCHSSMSISSSVTVISPENFSVETDWGSDERSDARSDTRVEILNTNTNFGAAQNEEVSIMLSEAMKDSLKTEASASVSGDEIETTASSDIEIIASPQAGIRKMLPPAHSRSNETKSHSREPSEASSEGSTGTTSTGQDLEPHTMEYKILQLNQLVEARENQLSELTRKCSKLTEEVEKFKSQAIHDEKERISLNETIRRQTDEFAVRLSSMEKRYQQILAEREALVKRLDQVQQNNEAHGNLAEDLREKNETIEQLRFEGEKLSKQHLHQSNIIKKLRTQEKEEEIRSKLLRDQNEELKGEVERLNKCLSAKEELERNQIEAVRLLTTTTSQLEKELMAIKVMMRDKISEAETLKAALENAEQNLIQERVAATARGSAETERSLSAEVSLRQRLQLEYDTSTRVFEEEKQALSLRCQELVHSLAEVDNDRSRERDRMQKEVSGLMHRLQEAETRIDELSQALTTATRPLLRQIDNLQNALTSQRIQEEKSEKMLKEKLALMESQLLSENQKKNANQDIYSDMQARVNNIEGELTIAKQENQKLIVQLDQEKSHCQSLEETRKKDVSTLELVKSQLSEELKLLRNKVFILENKNEQQNIALEEERKKAACVSNRLQDKELESQLFHMDQENGSSGIGRKPTSEVVSRSSSPTPSLGKLSLSGSFTESHSSNPWNPTAGEVFDEGLVTPVPKSTLYDTLRAGSYTAVFESLQAQLKTRDGEVSQLQQELQNQERSRNSLAKELTEMINSNQELSNRLSILEAIHVEYEDLKTNYNALLQMYGEKMEENEELRLDLVDVKEMYKIQIDQLTKT